MHCSKTLKLSFCLLLIFGIVVSSAFMPKVRHLSAHAETTAELQSKISNLESQKTEIKAKIDGIQDKVDENQEYLDTINSYIYTVEQKIIACESLLAEYDAEVQKLNEDIAKQEKNLKKNKELFKRRIRSIYMTGSGSSLDFILDSDSYADHLAMNEFTESIANYDKSMMIKINKVVAKINKKVKAKKQAIAAQEEVKAQLASDRAELESQQAEAQAALNAVQKSKEELKAELDELNSNIAAYENRIQEMYEAARRQAEVGNVEFTPVDGFAWPLPGYSTVVSGFGGRFDPYYGVYRGHNGIDISGPGVEGKPIIASAAGVVMTVEPEASSGGYGNYVVINHGMQGGNLITTHYAHMSYYVVSVGQKVNQGDVLGYVGTTGASTGYHLHFEVRVNNTPVNPLGYVQP